MHQSFRRAREEWKGDRGRRSHAVSDVFSGLAMYMRLLSLLVLSLQLGALIGACGGGVEQSDACQIDESSRINLPTSGLNCGSSASIVYLLADVRREQQIDTPVGRWKCSRYSPPQTKLEIRCSRCIHFFTVSQSP